MGRGFLLPNSGNYLVIIVHLIMLKMFKQHIDTDLPFLQNGRLLVAVSGGRDSCVLTHLCHELELEFAIAHCNFKLRGGESDRDTIFVNA